MARVSELTTLAECVLSVFASAISFITSVEWAAAGTGLSGIAVVPITRIQDTVIRSPNETLGNKKAIINAEKV